MSRHICRILPRIYPWVLVVSVLATVLGGYLTSRLDLESDLAALLPSSFPSVQALEAMEEEVGGAVSSVRVVLTGADFDRLVRFAEDLKPRLEESEMVLYAQFENETSFYEEHALLLLRPAQLDSLHEAVRDAVEEEKQEANPFMVDDLFGDPDPEEETSGDALAAWEERYADEEALPYLTDPDSSVLVIQVAASDESADLESSRRMIAFIQSEVAELDPSRYAEGLEVLYGGNIKNRVDEYEALIDDILGTALYGFGAMLLLLILYFRAVVAPLLIAASLIASLSWTFGLTYLLIGQLNTITGFLFVILFGLGIDYGIHAFARYRETRQAGLDQQQALHKMTCDTGRALATTTLTTSAAFFSLLLMDFRGFSELGLITGLGLIFAFLAMILLLPALIILSERLGLLRIREKPTKSLEVEPRPFRPARSLLIGAGVVTALALVAATQVGFQYDFTDLRYITPERERVGELTRDVFTRSESPALVLTSSREEARAVERQIERQMAMDTVTPTVDQVRSIHSLIPPNQEERLERIRAIRAYLEEEDVEDLLSGEDLRRLNRLQSYLAVDEPVTLEDVPREEIRPFLTRSGEVGSFVFIYPAVPLRDGRNAILFAEDIGEIELPSGEVFHAASPNLVLADLLQMVIREGRIALLLTLLVVTLIVFADLRNLRATFLVITPLVLGLVWMGGFMYLLGMKLNLFNIVVLPSVVGIGVDSAVHIHHRYREEGTGSVPFVVRRTGMAVAVATVTTMLGFGGLVVAGHPGLNSIGHLALVGLTATLVTSLLVLPSLLQVAEER